MNQYQQKPKKKREPNPNVENIFTHTSKIKKINEIIENQDSQVHELRDENKQLSRKLRTVEQKLVLLEGLVKRLIGR